MKQNNPTRRKVLVSLILVLAMALMAGNALAGTTTVNLVSLTVPNNYIDCAPADTIKVTGIPESGSLYMEFFEAFGSSLTKLGAVTGTNITGGVFTRAFPYPAITPGVHTFVVHVSVWNLPAPDFTGTPIAKLTGKWTVTCGETPPPPPPPPPADEGCTPGYWKQSQHFDSWVGYDFDDDFAAVFSVDPSFDPHTLLDAVSLGGGGEKALARHAVAALLNASSPGVDYNYSTAQVISMVQSAYASGNFQAVKNLFEEQNESYCPLD